MKKFLFGVVAALVMVLLFRFCENKNNNREQLVANTALIQKELKNVGKLIVTEGQYSQVLTYKSNRDIFYGLHVAEKSALVVINAKATISYDLRKIQTEIDEHNKTVYITKIPEPELNIYPEIEYYDIRQDMLNPFQASDHNTIRRRVDKQLREEIEKSELKSNAENRLISELQKIYILTNSLGWTLQYNQEVIQQEEDIRDIL